MIKVVITTLFIFNLIACNPAQQASQKKNTLTQSPFTCLASQSRCEVLADHGTFTVKFSGQLAQGKVKTELPLNIQLLFNGKKADIQLKSVSSYLEGKTMFMGKIPVFFQLNEQGINIAETLLASCSEEVMTWRLWLTADIIQAGKVSQQTFFIDFDSQRL